MTEVSEPTRDEFVAVAIVEAAAFEREECAKICDMANSDRRYPAEVRALARVLARAIRKRGDAAGGQG